MTVGGEVVHSGELDRVRQVAGVRVLPKSVDHLNAGSVGRGTKKECEQAHSVILLKLCNKKE